MDDMKVYARKEAWTDSVSIYFAEDYKDGYLSIAKQIEFEKIKKSDAINRPALNLQHTSAQRLMDELWSCGLRPSEGTGSAGSLKATENHLADMQKIAFRLLERNV